MKVLEVLHSIRKVEAANRVYKTIIPVYSTESDYERDKQQIELMN